MGPPQRPVKPFSSVSVNDAECAEMAKGLTRRQLFGRATTGIGVAALASLLTPEAFPVERLKSAGGALTDLPHFPPRAKRIIYLFQSGGPSQLDLFDYKPKLKDLYGTDLPDSIRMGQRLTGMTSGQNSFPTAPSLFKFARHGKSGILLSELLPYTSRVVDDMCFIKSVHTQAINHDPGITFFQTGHQLAGRPSVGAWLSYGLGSENHDLPAYVVLVSQGTGRRDGNPLYERLWGSGFLPSNYQGVKFRSSGDPVLYLSNPAGLSDPARRRMLDDVAKLNQLKFHAFGDPEIVSRIAQYELAYRMQSSVPDLMDISSEPGHVVDMYGPEARKPGTYAANCLLARRLCERGVRFVQLFHRGWDQHGSLPEQIRNQCRDTDQASAALISDLKQQGLLDDTLVVWGGEFGRTVYCQGGLTKNNYGRDHHPRCFTIWMAGGGVRGGITYGVTDDYSYNIVENPVHVHDVHATMLHCLGIDHTKLTFKFQGRHHRLTDIHGRVVTDVLV